jgi:hypothetical protein
MVTAGVFMVCRCSAMFELAPYASGFVTVVGAITAFFAATVGLAQNDIKRVVAYSTCSQLGYMFFAAGVGAYNVAMFHLFTHAFFKALLFLSAGSVIHGLHHEQDMRFMGGVRKKMKITYAMMLIGTLALERCCHRSRLRRVAVWPYGRAGGVLGRDHRGADDQFLFVASVVHDVRGDVPPEPACAWPRS